MAVCVEILDGMMGCYKTTRTIEWMENNPNNRYIYISPLLSEVGVGGRLVSSVSKISFEVPKAEKGSTKSDHLLELIREGYNICCTHSLYLSISAEHLFWIERHGYVLVIDEEVNVVSSVDHYSKDDFRWLNNNGKLSVSDEDGMVSWVCDKEVGENHKYFRFKQLCDHQALYVTKRDDTMMVTQLPIKLITAARRVVVLTYMFDGNILDCFLKVKGVPTKKFDEVVIEDVSKEEIRKLITLLPKDNKLSKFSLSHNWYQNATKAELDEVGRFITRVGKNSAKCNFEDLMYTLPKSRHEAKGSRNIVKPPNFFRKRKDGVWQYNWLAASTRATNDYQHKTTVVHCYSRFPNTPVEAYLGDYGASVSRNVFALSEMLQWIWRSQIRQKKPITVGIACKRMHKLFEDWLKYD